MWFVKTKMLHLVFKSEHQIPQGSFYGESVKLQFQLNNTKYKEKTFTS